jgi:predicted small lipoprotein YifL
MIRASLVARRAASRTVLLWGAVLWGAAALALAACGRVGPLDQPAPLYGEKAKADYQARKKAEAAAKASKDQDEPEPLAADTPGPDNPGAVPDNLRTNPAQGMRPLPDAPPPANVLPDPYNRPQ